jgi:8-oxo-dGTP pyrophosphatase MutT (NUDIX family)
MQIDPRIEKISDCLYRVAVKAAIIKDRKILLVHEKGDEWWSLPGGGIDQGESTDQALRRELSEELGVAPNSIQAEKNILFVTIGAVVAGIPRANLYYRVDIPINDIKTTEHVIESGWFTASELATLYLSPSTGNIKDQLRGIVEF